MSSNNPIPQYDASHFAVVDLGSNSFHLIITQLTTTPNGKSLNIVNKVKRKVRLAAGLNADNNLSQQAIREGLSCLKHFALFLSTIPLSNITVVATAALRIAQNNQTFLDAGTKILPKPITLLSGDQEAQIIYRGAVHNSIKKSSIEQRQLVFDIGGASTEIIVGKGPLAKKMISLDIGCVSFLGKYFNDGKLTSQNFNLCIEAAMVEINNVKENFIKLGWQSVIGRSGTIQALIEILREKQSPEIIDRSFLYDIKARLISCNTINNIQLPGLREDRKLVLASGLSILIALFECLNINELSLSNGALREGLLLQLVPDAFLI